MSALSEPEIPSCPICVNPYSDDVVPKILKECGHTYCTECIAALTTTFVRTEPYDPVGACARCPYDRVATRVPQGTPDRLPTNFAVVSVVEEAKKLTSVTSKQPEKQPEEPVATKIHRSHFSCSHLLKERCHENAAHEAVLHCKECRANLCIDCCIRVHSLRIFDKHNIGHISVGDKNNCPVHRDQEVTYKCRVRANFWNADLVPNRFHKTICSAVYSIGCQKCFDAGGEHASHGSILQDPPHQKYPYAFIGTARASITCYGSLPRTMEGKPVTGQNAVTPLQCPAPFSRTATLAHVAPPALPANPPPRRHGKLRRLFNRIF